MPPMWSFSHKTYNSIIEFDWIESNSIENQTTMSTWQYNGNTKAMWIHFILSFHLRWRPWPQKHSAGWIVSLHEAQQRWRALANVTGAAVDIGVNSPSIHPFSVSAYPCTQGHAGSSEPILARVKSQWGKFHFWVNFPLFQDSFSFIFQSHSMHLYNTKPLPQFKNKRFRAARMNAIPVKAEFLFQFQTFTVDIYFILFYLHNPVSQHTNCVLLCWG